MIPPAPFTIKSPLHDVTILAWHTVSLLFGIDSNTDYKLGIQVNLLLKSAME